MRAHLLCCFVTVTNLPWQWSLRWCLQGIKSAIVSFLYFVGVFPHKGLEGRACLITASDGSRGSYLWFATFWQRKVLRKDKIFYIFQLAAMVFLRFFVKLATDIQKNLRRKEWTLFQCQIWEGFCLHKLPHYSLHQLVNAGHPVLSICGQPSGENRPFPLRKELKFYITHLMTLQATTLNENRTRVIQ